MKCHLNITILILPIMSSSVAALTHYPKEFIKLLHSVQIDISVCVI